MDFEGFNTVPDVFEISDEMGVGSWSSDEEYVEEKETVQMAYCVGKVSKAAGNTVGRVLSVGIPYPPKSASKNSADCRRRISDSLFRFGPWEETAGEELQPAKRAPNRTIPKLVSPRKHSSFASICRQKHSIR